MATITLPIKANRNDKIMINNQEIIVKNSYELINDDNGNNGDEYYKIGTRKGILFKIDKKDLLDILVYISIDNIYTVMEWDYDCRNKRYIVSKFVNNNDNNSSGSGNSDNSGNSEIINILNYLKKDYTNLGNKKLNVVFLNDDYYDFRSKNIKDIPVIGKNSTKFKYIDTKPKFDNVNDTNETNEINQTTIIQEFSGHQKNVGTSANIERNKYKLVEITNNDGSKIKYYEVSLGKFDKNNDEYTFIIDIEDKCILDNIYLLNNKFIYKTDNLTEEEKNQLIIYKNPTWRLMDNQYISTVITIKGISNETIYIHRLLLGCQKENKDTVDHINGNKFDNRRCNLRICNMSVQNMNRGMVSRKTTLNDILNSNSNSIEQPTQTTQPTQTPQTTQATQATPSISEPNLQLTFKNIEFISYISENVKNKNTITKRDGFAIEISGTRCGLSKSIETCSTLSEISIFKTDKNKMLSIKLAHAVCIRYLSIKNNLIILKYSIDNKKFETIEEFKTHSEKQITEIMKEPYTIDSFLDYMNTLKITKYNDPRISKIITNETNIEDIKFNFIQYSSARNKYDVDFIIGKDSNGEHIKLKKNGSGEKTLSIEDKKSFALVQRYNAFIELENDLNKQIHKDIPFSSTMNNINNNTSNLKSLTDFEMESKKFKNFDEFRQHTEYYINKLLNPIIPYTLETFSEYITKKANSKKINLEVSKCREPLGSPT